MELLRLRELYQDYKIPEYCKLLPPVLIGIYIFCNPFPHTTTIREISFYLSIFITLLLIFKRKFPFSFKFPFTVPFALYLIWAFASILWSVDKGNSLHDWRTYLLDFIVVYYMLVNFFNSRKRFMILIWIIIISITLFSIQWLVNFYILTGNPLSVKFTPDIEIPVNCIGKINMFAAILSLFAFLNENKFFCKSIFFLSFLVTLTALFVTYSRAVFVALAVSLIFLLILIKNTKKVIMLVLLILIAAGLVISSTPSLKNKLTPDRIVHDCRVVIWYVSIEMIKDRPIGGFGFGREIFQKYMWNKYYQTIPEDWKEEKCNIPFQDPHNFLLHISARLGVVGLAFFLLIIFMAFRMGWVILKSRNTFIRNWGSCLMATLSGLLVAGLFGNILFPEGAVILYTSFAMITILWRIDQSTDGRDIKVS